MKFLLLTFFCLGTLIVHAEKFHFGIKSNIAISDISLTTIKRDVRYYNGEQTKYLEGFCGGLFVEVPILKYASIQAEALYSQAGFKHNFNAYYGLTDDWSYHYRLNYWSFPVVAKARWKGFALVAGIQYSSLISAKRSEPAGQIGSTRYSNSDVKSSHQNKEWALLYGVEYTAPFGLGANFRYHYGLTSISNLSVPSSYEQVYKVDDNIYNSIIQFGIYWRFLK